MNTPALLSYLKEVDTTYFAKIAEVRESVEDWLSYIPNTFPHYTRHTIKHSDEIVLQMSKLLFWNDDPTRPTIKLSPIEAYILIISAFLHDSGMVCSDDEKLTILESEEWKEWIIGGAATDRWRQIEKLRNLSEKTPADDFVADVQTRFLVAEYVRMRHHSRSSDILQQHHAALGRCAFDDPMLARTIGAVCEGHGLRSQDLEDASRYPEERDVRGQKVNVRLMSCLLRLGDLLDMTCDRACPILLNAACPLPADSLAHWTQYQRITHRLTRPDRIEIVAECANQNEHRILQDWCQWIVDEVRSSKLILSSASRHGNWEPPSATFGPQDNSITIKPSPTASYLPTSWRLELDSQAVLDRLINDVYTEKAAFVRELIQNAADACRCRLYSDLISNGVQPPKHLNEVGQSAREAYVIRVSLETRNFGNELSGTSETRQVLVVEDNGVGMDKHVITKYFLQVGRSFYTSAEFRQHFNFSPTSRFGVGFLSVFSVSDSVTVDTFKHSSTAQDDPVFLKLTGPRNYLLTEKGKRTTPGTKIEVVLTEELRQGQLSELVRMWCRRLEFAVIVNDLGDEFRVTSETSTEFECEIADYSEDGGRFLVRSFPITEDGLFGEIYVFVNQLKQGEDWTNFSWAKFNYVKEFPNAEVPAMPASLRCWNGISLEGGSTYSLDAMVARVDIRRRNIDLTLSRSAARDTSVERDITKCLEKVLSGHLSKSPLATGAESWKYKQRLCANMPRLDNFWREVEGTIPYRKDGIRHSISLRDFLNFEKFVVFVYGARSIFRDDHTALKRKRKLERDCANTATVPALVDNELTLFDQHIRENLFRESSVSKVFRPTKNIWAVEWIRELRVPERSLSKNLRTAPFDDEIRFGIVAHEANSHTELVILNERHQFTRWILRTKEVCNAAEYELSEETFGVLIDLVNDAVRYMSKVDNLLRFIGKWALIAQLPLDLMPPTITGKEVNDQYRGN